MNLGYEGEDREGIYHSIYDDFYWYTHFSDTDFSYGRALSQTVGSAVMRLADADLLPYDFTDLADTIHKYTDELQKLLKKKQDEIAEQNKEVEDGDLVANADPKKPYVAPAVEEAPPHLNFAPLLNASDVLARSAKRYQKALDSVTTDGGLTLGQALVKSLNATLMQSERKLTSADGLPGRPWYQHMVYAPGFYTGYGVKTIPGVREAIEQKKWKEADQQMARVGIVLEDEAALIDSAAAELEKQR